jgi:hypothetical protein
METKHVRIRDVNVNIWHKLKIIAAEKNVTMAKALEIVTDFYWQKRKEKSVVK